MQPRPVEPRSHGELDVAPQCVVTRRGVDPFRVEALVENQPLKHRLVVDQHPEAIHVHFAEAEVAVHAVELLAVLLQHDLEVVEIRLAGLPQMGLVDLEQTQR